MLSNPADEYANKTVILDNDAGTVAWRELLDGAFAFKTLAESIKPGQPVSLGLAYSVLSVTESRLVELCKTLGVELDSAQARTERFAALRAANSRIAQLERDLGQSATVAHVASGMSALAERLERWWNDDGMGYVSELKFNRRGGVELKLACLLEMGGPRPGMFSRNPVTGKASQKEWQKSKAEEGFELVQARGEDEYSLKDCDRNRELLEALVLQALPSALIHEMRSTVVSIAGNQRVRILRELSVYVQDLADLHALPAPGSALEGA